MRMSLRALVALLAATCCTAAFADAVPDRLGEPIDFSSFSGPISGPDETRQQPDADAMPIVPVDYDGDVPWIRGYVTGIVGGSLATINAGGSTAFGGTTQLQTVGSVNDTIFNGGGAIGMAIARPSGLLRMEVEGRARGPMQGQTAFEIASGTTSGAVIPLDVTVTNGWSAMTNFWRDYFFNDYFGVYGGGGFGVGGYQYSMQGENGAIPLKGSSVVNTFAWQVGTGVTYQVSDRITFDTGYRFFAMTPGATPLAVTSGGFLVQPVGSYTSAFSASELLVSIRIYEPFRNWR
jgi:opacity protein-like surface antigen